MGEKVENEEAEEGEKGDDVDELLGPRRRRRQRETARLGCFVLLFNFAAALWSLDNEGIVLVSTMAVELRERRAQRLSMHRREIERETLLGVEDIELKIRVSCGCFESNSLYFLKQTKIKERACGRVGGNCNDLDPSVRFGTIFSNCFSFVYIFFLVHSFFLCILEG